MDAIDRLLDEHRGIRLEIESLKRSVQDLAAHGEAALVSAREPLAAVARMMGTTLLDHARKEDDALFPAMERVFGLDGSPTGVMREEHREIRDRADLFRKTLHQLNQVEHPAIVAGGARLAALTTGTGSAGELIQLGERLIELLESHFAKEEDILFPMARAALEPSALVEVGRRMDEIEGATTRS
jgi:hemerythrin-like domain-containing protein